VVIQEAPKVFYADQHSAVSRDGDNWAGPEYGVDGASFEAELAQVSAP
jgi:hypothetical protein